MRAEGYFFIGGSMTALGVAVKGAVDDVVSRINGKIGRGTVKQASAIVGGNWNMRQKYLSPRYTTEDYFTQVLKECELEKPSIPFKKKVKRNFKSKLNKLTMNIERVRII